MAETTHLQLPLLAAAQAQKHVTHNDAILRLDAMVQLSVEDRDLTSPPGAPADGGRYIPASGSTGAWEDWDLNIAWYVDGVWTKLVPRPGWRVWVEDEDMILVYDGADWVHPQPILQSLPPENPDAVWDTTSDVFADVTGFNGSITLTQTSRVRLYAVMRVYTERADAAAGCRIRAMRDGAERGRVTPFMRADGATFMAFDQLSYLEFEETLGPGTHTYQMQMRTEHSTSSPYALITQSSILVLQEIRS